MASRAKQIAHDPPQAVDEPVAKKATKKVVHTGAGSAAPDAVVKNKKKVVAVANVSEDANIDTDLMDLVPNDDDAATAAAAAKKKKLAKKTEGAAKKTKAAEPAKKGKKTVGNVIGGKVAGIAKKTVNKDAADALFGKHKKALPPGKRELREITKEMKKLRNTAIKPASFENMARQVTREVHGKRMSAFTAGIRKWQIRMEEMVHILLNHASDASKLGDKKSLWIDHLNLSRKALHGKHHITWTLQDRAQNYRDDLPSIKRNRDVTK
jgi:hypothetical protein